MTDEKAPKSPSGVSDLDRAFRRRVGREIPRSEDYTPITNLSDLAPAISQIKRGQDRTADAVDNLDRIVRSEMKPKLDQVREGFIRLETEHKATTRRLKAVEIETKSLSIASPQPHDCYHEDDIRGLEEGNRTTRADVASVKATQGAVAKDLDRVDSRHKTVIGIAASVVLFCLASAGGFAAAFYTVQADVGHLSAEQTNIRSEISQMRSAQTEVALKVQAAAVRVERAAKRVDDTSENPLEAVWCDLSPVERRRQSRLRGEEKVPERKCQ